MVAAAARPVAAAAVLVLLAGCAAVSDRHRFAMPGSGPAEPAARFWPAPPEIPRYRFIGHLRGESNRPTDGRSRGAWARLFAALVGLDARPRDTLDLLRPQQVAGDDDGRLYVTDPGQRSIFVFDENLGEFSVWNERSLDVALPSPIGIVHAEDSLWVTDAELGLVYRLSQAGEVIGRFGHERLVRPTGIGFDAARGRLFVSDTAAGDIKLFDSGGRLLDTWGRAGSGPGEFNRPTYLAYRGGRLYVVDSLNARVQILDADGRFVRELGRRGLYVGNFSRPKGIALDSDGNIYVSESYYDYLLVYDGEGRLLLSIGGSGGDAGEFLQPTGLWVDARDRVFVSDMLNRRVSIFHYLGSD